MRIVWDQEGKRFYETGVDQGVLYVKNASGAYGKGVAWNGLTSVEENPEGAEDNDLYADNIKYLILKSVEEFKATVNAYTYPEEFKECDGTKEVAQGVYMGQQARSRFGFCYKTKIGNDLVADDLGYKLHIVYNAQVTPSSKSYATINDSPEAIEFSWELSTLSEKIEGFKGCAAIVIDSTKADPDKLKELEDKLYGTESSEPMLPTMQEVIDMMKVAVLESLVLKTNPTKTSYTVGETFDPTGFEATASYSDSTSETITADEMTYAPMELNDETINKVVASYEYQGVTKTCDIPVTVTAGP